MYIKSNSTSIYYKSFMVTNDEMDVIDNQGAHNVDALVRFQIDFQITATNQSGDKKEFHIICQSEDTSDRLKAYSGFGMDFGDSCTCKSGHIDELAEFFGDETGAIGLLKDEADKLSKAQFEQFYETSTVTRRSYGGSKTASKIDTLKITANGTSLSCFEFKIFSENTVLVPLHNESDKKSLSNYQIGVNLTATDHLNKDRDFYILLEIREISSTLLATTGYTMVCAGDTAALDLLIIEAEKISRATLDSMIQVKWAGNGP